VADIDDMLRSIQMAQEPEQDVEHDRHAAIADVDEIVNRRAARIHAHPPRGRRDRGILPVERSEEALFARERTVELQFHQTPGRLAPASDLWREKAAAASGFASA